MPDEIYNRLPMQSGVIDASHAADLRAALVSVLEQRSELDALLTDNELRPLDFYTSDTNLNLQISELVSNLARSPDKMRIFLNAFLSEFGGLEFDEAIRTLHVSLERVPDMSNLVVPMTFDSEWQRSRDIAGRLKSHVFWADMKPQEFGLDRAAEALLDHLDEIADLDQGKEHRPLVVVLNARKEDASDEFEKRLKQDFVARVQQALTGHASAQNVSELGRSTERAVKKLSLTAITGEQLDLCRDDLRRYFLESLLPVDAPKDRALVDVGSDPDGLKAFAADFASYVNQGNGADAVLLMVSSGKFADHDADLIESWIEDWRSIVETTTLARPFLHVICFEDHGPPDAEPERTGLFGMLGRFLGGEPKGFHACRDEVEACQKLLHRLQDRQDIESTDINLWCERHDTKAVAQASSEELGTFQQHLADLNSSEAMSMKTFRDLLQAFPIQSPKG